MEKGKTLLTPKKCVQFIQLIIFQLLIIASHTRVHTKIILKLRSEKSCLTKYQNKFKTILR